MAESKLVILRGAGSWATGIAQKFFRAGIPVLLLESQWPTALLRGGALCDAVYDGKATVDDLTAVLVQSGAEVRDCYKRALLPVMVDPSGKCIAQLRPAAVIDATMQGAATNTQRGLAPITIGVGAGFAAGSNVHAVVETQAGGNFGRVIFSGSTYATAVPTAQTGCMAATTTICAPFAGQLRAIKSIGDIVHKGQALLLIEQQFVPAPTDGMVLGLIRPGLHVPQGTAIACLAPTGYQDAKAISPAARCIGGSVLEAYLALRRQKGANSAAV